MVLPSKEDSDEAFERDLAAQFSMENKEAATDDDAPLERGQKKSAPGGAASSSDGSIAPAADTAGKTDMGMDMGLGNMADMFASVGGDGGMGGLGNMGGAS